MERGRILGVVLLAAVTAGAIGYAASRQAEEWVAEEAAYQAYLDALPLAESEGETCSPNGRFQVRPAAGTAAERFSPRRFLTVGGGGGRPRPHPRDSGAAWVWARGRRRRPEPGKLPGAGRRLFARERPERKNLSAGVQFGPAGAFIRANRQGREIIADLFADH